MAKAKFPNVRTHEEEAEFDAWCRKNGGFSHADTYIVAYWGTNAEGFAERMEAEYYTNGKGKHKAVRARFAKDNPTATVISVTYV